MTTQPVTTPTISVVIPTHRRPDQLAITLAALARQTHPAEAREVIVVEDGATVETAQVVQSAGVRYLAQPKSGPTLARNLGAEQASGNVIVFVDDDIELLPESLAALVACLAEHPQAAVVGTLLTPKREAATRGGPEPIRADVPVHFTACLTGLLCVRANDFRAVGMFQDPTGGWPNWDDVDFGYRAYQAGLALWRSGAGRAIHHDATAVTLASVAERYYRASHAAARLFRRHPGLRAHLPMFQDKAPIDWQRDGTGLAIRKLARQIGSTGPALALLEGLGRMLDRMAPAAGLTQAVRRWVVGGYVYRGFRQGLKELE